MFVTKTKMLRSLNKLFKHCSVSIVCVYIICFQVSQFSKFHPAGGLGISLQGSTASHG